MTASSSQTDENNSKLQKFIEDVGKLADLTNAELYMFKHDKNKLRDEILKIIKENQAVNSEINNIRNSEKIENTNAIKIHEKLTNDAISKLKDQINIVREERDTIKTLWKTSQETISNLEKEITVFRNQVFKPNSFTEIKEKYISTIEYLETAIKTVRRELDKQITNNKELLRLKNFIDVKLKACEAKIQEQEKEITQIRNIEKDYLCVKEKLKELTTSNKNLEKSLAMAKKLIDERFYREKVALEKVQEALLIAENAIAEKDDAFNREIVIRQECDHLATTIGQVMEEAALKVEKDVNKLRKSYQNEIAKLNESHNEVLRALENQKRFTEYEEVRCKDLENKIGNILQENATLEKHVQMASQAIVEMELKMTALENLMNQDSKISKFSDDRDQQIEQFMLQNQHLKERYKKVIQDITQKFESKIASIQDENKTLKAENEELKVRLMELE